MNSSIVVSKFGGTSLSDGPSMERSAAIAGKQGASVVVVSATSGTTDQLVQLPKLAQNGGRKHFDRLLSDLGRRHTGLCDQINADRKLKQEVRELTGALETTVDGLSLLDKSTPKAEDKILSFGERLSSLLFAQVFQEKFPRKDVRLLDIREVMITDDEHGRANPLPEEITRRAKHHFELSEDRVYITQGFIGRTKEGVTTTLGRGGSDYSAALIAEAVSADVLEIWTDVAGISTTDPRVCRKARPIGEISYEEAGEMAQYGAKILHPATLVPAMRRNIPVFVGSSFDRAAKGTWIKREVGDKPQIRAITHRPDQALLTIRTPEMLDAVGFMDDIFKVFARHRISVDSVTTSEISVAISLDQSIMNHKSLVTDLEDLGEVQFETGHTLISLIGNDLLNTKGIAKSLFDALGDINVRMMCLGASSHNFNLLVDEVDGTPALQRIHRHFIEK